MHKQSYTLDVKTPPKPKVVLFCDMPDGAIGRIVDAVGGHYRGEVVMRKWDKVVSLNPDSSYWSSLTGSNTVELLPPGSVLTITVGE